MYGLSVWVVKYIAVNIPYSNVLEHHHIMPHLMLPLHGVTVTHYIAVRMCHMLCYHYMGSLLHTIELLGYFRILETHLH